METRHLQRTGRTSFTVTLPKTWVQAQGLSEKDKVWMKPQSSGAMLILPSGKQPVPESVIFEIGQLNSEWLTRELISYYLAGADEISVVCERITPEQRTTIRRACQWLIGLEIIEETSSEVVLRNLFDNTKFPVSQNIQKILAISRSMLSDALKALDTGDTDLGQDVIDRDTEVDKIHFIITRQFNSLLGGRVSEDRLGLTLPEANYYSYLAIQLERIADHAAKIARIGLGLTKSQKPGNGLLKVEAASVLGLLERVEAMIPKLDRAEAQRLIDDYQLREKKKAMAPLPLVADSLDRVRRYILNIAEMTINFSVWKSLA